METKAVTVSGRDVVTKINVDGNVQTITNGPNAGQPYFRGRFDGKGFIVTEDFFNKWTAGEVAEVNLTPSTYDVDDPQNPGQPIKRESWQVSAWATYEQITKIAAQEGKLALGAKKLEVEMQVIEKKALAELKLDDATVGKLQGAV